MTEHCNSIGYGQTKRCEIVVLVDPYSTGCVIALEILKRGYQIFALWSHDIADENKLHVPNSCSDLNYARQIISLGPNRLDATAQLLEAAAKEINGSIISLICGGEHGVGLADALGENMGLISNGTGIANRRDKKLQQELVAARGLRSVRQAGGHEFELDVKEFLLKEEYPVVVKPVESAGSDGVKLCYNFDEAKEHFNILKNSQMRVGCASGAAVLCQEFLKGTEYVVDHVSRDGVHKTVMVWMYDKRPANGGDFVYFGLIPVDSGTAVAKVLISYTRGVLDAMGVKHGASHGEVILRSDGPCLVEMNCRAHGGDGNWRGLVCGLNGGYSQVEATVDAYLDPESFNRLPDKMPSPFQKAGQEVTLVSYARGIVKRTPGFEAIHKLPSFVTLETSYHVGSKVEPTVDLFTCIGSVILMHDDPTVVERDHDFIRHLEETNTLFDLEYSEDVRKHSNDSPVILSVASTPDASDEEGISDVEHPRRDTGFQKRSLELSSPRPVTECKEFHVSLPSKRRTIAFN